MKIGAVIQARMGSTRLSGKVMKEIAGKTVLEHVIERVRQSKAIDSVVIATTIHDRDDVIVDEAIRCKAKYFRGSEEDVLSRYYYASKENSLDVVIRITSDCPLIDPFIIDEIIEYYINNDYDIVSNAGPKTSDRTYPRGLDTEVFSFIALERAFHKASESYQREHVTPYIYENNKVYYYKNKTDYSRFRWTLDTDDDLRLIREIYKDLYNGKHDFYMDEIIKLFESKPELYNINAHIVQKKLIE